MINHPNIYRKKEMYSPALLSTDLPLEIADPERSAGSSSSRGHRIPIVNLANLKAKTRYHSTCPPEKKLGHITVPDSGVRKYREVTQQHIFILKSSLLPISLVIAQCNFTNKDITSQERDITLSFKGERFCDGGVR
jgi:hypothetical protein